MILAIDPGFDFGYALFTTGGKLLIDAGVSLEIGFTKKLELPERASDVAYRVALAFHKSEKYLRENGASREELKKRVAVIEWHVFFDSSFGQAVAKRGDLSKLIYSSAFIARELQTQGFKIILAPVTSWKGQLSKSAVESRIEKRLSPIEQSVRLYSHAYDAVGIGLWHLGKF